MYEDVMRVIEAGGYDLADLLRRIDVLYVGGRLTDEEREALADEARSKADPTAAYAPMEQRLEALEAWRTEVEQRLAAIEAGGSEPVEPEEPADEYPPYVQPTGAHDAYYAGDKVSWNGGKYTCIAPEGVACVWDPGTYPAYWRKDG